MPRWRCWDMLAELFRDNVSPTAALVFAGIFSNIRTAHILLDKSNALVTVASMKHSTVDRHSCRRALGADTSAVVWLLLQHCCAIAVQLYSCCAALLRRLSPQHKLLLGRWGTHIALRSVYWKCHTKRGRFVWPLRALRVWIVNVHIECLE